MSSVSEAFVSNHFYPALAALYERQTGARLLRLLRLLRGSVAVDRFLPGRADLRAAFGANAVRGVHLFVTMGTIHLVFRSL